MSPTPWDPTSEVAYFRDPDGVWVAAELVRAHSWTSSLTAPLDRSVADIRLAFLRSPEPPSITEVPGWLVILSPEDEAHPGLVMRAAMGGWRRSPFRRSFSAAPEEYVRAGFQALCPPHPRCEPGPDAREYLTRFLADRPGSLGVIGNQSYDGFNRLASMYWDTPEAFAEEILRERIRDQGVGRFLELTSYLARAVIPFEAGELTTMAMERTAILERLQPERFFTEAQDFDRAVAAAQNWASRYDRSYRAHYRTVSDAARSVMEEIALAVARTDELEILNRSGRAVGEDALRRLTAAVAEIESLVQASEPGQPQWGGVILGRLPTVFTEARLAAAAVLAALAVQHRRNTVARRLA